MHLKIMSLVVMFFLLSPSAFGAQIHLNKEIESIPAKISDIYYCGNWQYKGNTGFYRIIYVEFHYGCSLLYVQWMLDRNFEDGRTKIMHTLSIEEFNANDHIEMMFDKPECKKTDQGIKLSIVTDSGHDDKKRKVTIDVLHEFGKYRYSEHVIK